MAPQSELQTNAIASRLSLPPPPSPLPPPSPSPLPPPPPLTPPHPPLFCETLFPPFPVLGPARLPRRRAQAFTIKPAQRVPDSMDMIDKLDETAYGTAHILIITHSCTTLAGRSMNSNSNLTKQSVCHCMARDERGLVSMYTPCDLPVAI